MSRDDRQPPPVVLKPYTAQTPLPWRIVGWTAVALLGIGCVFYGFGYALTTPFMLKEFMAPLVPLACVAVWALPASKSKPTRVIEGLFWAFLIVTMIWPNYLAIGLPGLPRISAVRLVGLPLAVALLVRLSTSRAFVEEIRSTVRTIPYLGTFMAGFVAVQVFSIAVSDQPVTSADVVLDNQIGWTAIFYISCYVFRRPGAAEKAAALFCISAVGLAFLGLWEMRIEHLPWAGHVPSFFPIDDPAVQRTLVGGRRLGTGAYRVEGVQSTPLGFAEFLALATPFLIHFMVGKFRPLVRVLSGLSLPLVFFVILGTHARLGMVGLFLSVLLYLIIWAVNRWKNARGSLLGPAVVAAYPAIFCGFFAASFAIQRLKNIIWGNGETKDSNAGRLVQMQTGLPMIATHPWGYGTSRGAEKLGFTDLAGTLTIDNYYLLVALDWGILGFIFYYGMILMVTWNAGRYGWGGATRMREHTFLMPAGIALAEFFVIKSIFSQTHNHKLQFMIMGMVAALIYRIRNGVPGDPLPSAPAQPASRRPG